MIYYYTYICIVYVYIYIYTYTIVCDRHGARLARRVRLAAGGARLRAEKGFLQH